MHMGWARYQYCSLGSQTKLGTVQRKELLSQLFSSSTNRQFLDDTTPYWCGLVMLLIQVVLNKLYHQLRSLRLSYVARSLHMVTMSHNIQKSLGFLQLQCMKLLKFSPSRLPTTRIFLSIPQIKWVDCTLSMIALLLQLHYLQVLGHHMTSYWYWEAFILCQYPQGKK